MKKLKSIALLIAVMMMVNVAHAAKQVIILNSVRTDGPFIVRYVLWVTAVTPVARPGAVSVWKGASGAESAAIAAGTIIEVQGELQVPAAATKLQIQTQLQAIFVAAQAAVTSTPQGCFWDGTVWSC